MKGLCFMLGMKQIWDRLCRCPGRWECPVSLTLAPGASAPDGPAGRLVPEAMCVLDWGEGETGIFSITGREKPLTACHPLELGSL